MKNKPFLCAVLFSATTFAVDVDAESECDVNDPIEVNNFVTTDVNLSVNIWRPNDTLTIHSSTNWSRYLYSPMFGRFVPTGISGGSGDGDGGGVGGVGGDGRGGPGGGCGMFEICDDILPT